MSYKKFFAIAIVTLFCSNASVHADDRDLAKSSCNGDLQAPAGTIIRSTHTEYIRNWRVAVERLHTGRDGNSKSHPGVPVAELFGPDPQIIFGIDTSNTMAPYLIIGDKTIRVVSNFDTTTTVLMPMGSVLMPMQQTQTNYQVGVVKGAPRVRAGYFFRVVGMKPEEIQQIAADLESVKVFGGSTPDWRNGVVLELASVLQSRAGLLLYCPEVCDRITHLIKGGSAGFQNMRGERFASQVYLLDQPSLEPFYRKQRNSDTLHQIGMTSLKLGAGVVAVGVVEILYEMAANIMHWPSVMEWLLYGHF